MLIMKPHFCQFRAIPRDSISSPVSQSGSSGLIKRACLCLFPSHDQTRDMVHI